VFYDGQDTETVLILTELFGEKLVKYNAAKKESLSEQLLFNMSNAGVDYLFCFGTSILKGRILEVFENRIINFHPSLLPSFSGLNAIDKALKSSVQLLGCTAHFIDNTVDGGLIIMQSCISRSVYRNYDDVLDLQIIMLERIWNSLDNSSIKVVEGMVYQETVNHSTFHSL